MKFKKIGLFASVTLAAVTLVACGSEKKAEDKEGKDEPSKDNQQQALIDQRYFQVLLTKRLVFTGNLG